MPVTWGMEDLAARMEVASGGRFILKVEPAGSITPATEEWKGVHTGVLDWAGGGGGYAIAEIPWNGQLIQPAAGMPPEPLQIWLDIEGCDIANNAYASLGYDMHHIKGAGFAGPPEIFIHLDKELNTLDDLKGLKMRSAGDGAKVLAAMGVGTVFMPLGEVFEAMSRGLLDAYECSSPRFDWEMGLNEVGKYIYLNPIRAPTEVYQLLVKTSKFEALPDDLKMMFNELGEAETWDYHNKLIAGDIEALASFRDYGNIVLPLPLEIEEEFGRQAKIYIDGEMAKDATYKAVVESQRLFAKNFNDIYGLPSWATYSYR